MASTPHDDSAKKRVLEILRLLIENPGYYTKRMLAKKYGVGDSTISRDFKELENAGYYIDYDEKNRYFITTDKTTDQIKELFVLSDTEKKLINDALKDNTEEKEYKRIVHKLETLTNIPRIGNIIFSKPYLAKAAILLKAKKENKQVVLYNYRSTNSNKAADRIIEPFHIDFDEDILHAFDINRNDIRHFRISRIERLEQLDVDFLHKGKQNIIITDIFKIADNNPVKVHIRLKMGAYNELIERYPLSKAFLTPATDTKDQYDLICKVNRKFYGLQNFLLGYAQYIVEIIESQELKQHMKKQIKKIKY